MANYPRSLLITDGATFHVFWKCHNNDWLLSSPFAKRTYYELLLKYKDRYQVKIHSYCFMDNHPHLTGYCETQKGLSDFFRVVNACFAKALNKKLNRRGQVVMDRFQSPQIKTEADLLKVMFYVDLNPYRTRRMTHPNYFKWSSFHHYAYGKKDPLITEPDCYLTLDSDPVKRQRLYAQMVMKILEDDQEKRKVFDQDYSQVYFIGDPKWVQERYEQITQYMRTKRQEWRQRIRRIGIT